VASVAVAIADGGFLFFLFFFLFFVFLKNRKNIFIILTNLFKTFIQFIQKNIGYSHGSTNRGRNGHWITT